jgi:hypothetical protein
MDPASWFQLPLHAVRSAMPEKVSLTAEQLAPIIREALAGWSAA